MMKNSGCESPASYRTTGRTEMIHQGVQLQAFEEGFNYNSNDNINIPAFTNDDKNSTSNNHCNLMYADSSDHLRYIPDTYDDGINEVASSSVSTSVSSPALLSSSLALTPKTHNKRRRRPTTTTGSTLSETTSPNTDTSISFSSNSSSGDRPIMIKKNDPNNNMYSDDDDILIDDDDDDEDSRRNSSSRNLNHFTKCPPMTGSNLSSRWSSSSSSYDCNSLERSLKRVRLSSSSTIDREQVNRCKQYNVTSAYYRNRIGTTSTSCSTSASRNSVKSPGELRLLNDIQHAVMNQNWFPKVDPFRIMTSKTSGSNNNNNSCIILEETWELQPFLYNIDDCSLRYQYDMSWTHQEQPAQTRVIKVMVGRQSKLDPMMITVHIVFNQQLSMQQKMNLFNYPSSSLKNDNDIHQFGIVLQLHFRRMYPHEPPIVQSIERIMTEESTGTLYFETKSMPSILFANTPGGEMKGHYKELNNDRHVTDVNSGTSSRFGDTIPLIPDRESCDQILRINRWTPLSRLSDIIGMLVEVCCKYYYDNNDISNKNNSVYSSPTSYNKDILIGSPSFHEQHQQEYSMKYDANSNYETGYDPSDNSSYNTTATNLTPTMSNTRRERNHEQHQQQQRHDLFWNNSNNNGLQCPDTFPVLSSSQQQHSKYMMNDDDETVQTNDSYSPRQEMFASTRMIHACSSMSVQYNRSTSSSSSYSSSSSNNNIGRSMSPSTAAGQNSSSEMNDRIVDVLLPAQVTFPPGRFNVGYNNSVGSNNSSSSNNNNSSIGKASPWTHETTDSTKRYNDHDFGFFIDDYSRSIQQSSEYMDRCSNNVHENHNYNGHTQEPFEEINETVAGHPHRSPIFDVIGGRSDQLIIIQPPKVLLSSTTVNGTGRDNFVVDHTSLMYEDYTNYMPSEGTGTSSSMGGFPLTATSSIWSNNNNNSSSSRDPFLPRNISSSNPIHHHGKEDNDDSDDDDNDCDPLHNHHEESLMELL